LPKVTNEYKEKRRQQLIDTAKKVFEQKGYAATTMSDIVAASDMSRGGVYQYFSSTEQVFRAINDQNDQNIKAYFERLLNEHKTAWDALETYLDERVEAMKNPNLGFAAVAFEYFVMSSRETDRSPYIQERLKRNKAAFTEFLQTGVDRGEFKPLTDLESIVMFTINLTDGMVLYKLVLGFDTGKIVEQNDNLKIYLKQVLQLEG